MTPSFFLTGNCEQREHAQQLLNRLTSDQVDAVVHLDPVSRKLASASLEDEEIGEEEERAVAEAREWSKPWWAQPIGR